MCAHAYHTCAQMRHVRTHTHALPDAPLQSMTRRVACRTQQHVVHNGHQRRHIQCRRRPLPPRAGPQTPCLPRRTPSQHALHAHVRCPTLVRGLLRRPALCLASLAPYVPVATMPLPVCVWCVRMCVCLSLSLSMCVYMYIHPTIIGITTDLSCKHEIHEVAACTFNLHTRTDLQSHKGHANVHTHQICPDTRIHPHESQ